MDIAFLYDTVPVDDDAQDRRPDYRAANDTALVGFARSGDGEAFDELVRRYRSDVYRTAYRYMKNREDAWDLTQESFVKAHGAVRRFRGDSSFKTWLLRITANRCKDFFKKRRLKTRPLDDIAEGYTPVSPDANPSGRLEAKEMGLAIEAAVSKLSDNHKLAFELREYEGYSYQEMAEVMGCSLGTVMSRLHHARKRLQAMLTEMGVVEGS